MISDRINTAARILKERTLTTLLTFASLNASQRRPCVWLQLFHVLLRYRNLNVKMARSDAAHDGL
jgi:hypothetical protein